MSVLFVCAANICRSPMAAAIYNALSEDRGLTWSAESAGLSALEGHDMADNVRTVLEEAGIPAPAHRSRRVGEGLLSEHALVLTMTPHQAEELRLFYPAQAHKVMALEEYARPGGYSEGVSDPYGQSLTAYRATARLLFDLIEAVIDRQRGELLHEHHPA